MRMVLRRQGLSTREVVIKFENLDGECNVARIHKTLRVTPAMAAGVADHVWSIEKVTAVRRSREKGRVAA